MNREIPLRTNPFGVFVPCAPSEAQAVGSVVFGTDGQTGAITGVIYFGGAAQAVVSYDDQNCRPVSYMMFNPAADLNLINSVESIVQYLNTIPPQLILN